LTLGRIAEDLGVSKATVSLVLNGKAKEKKVSPVTARRVAEYCQRKKYAVNAHARKMNSRLAKNIGLILFGGYTETPNPLGEHCTSIISGGITMAAKDADFTVTLLITEKEEDIGDLLQRFYSKDVDGFIVVGFPEPASWRKAFKSEKIPIAIVGGNPQHRLPTVNINDSEMSFQMTEYVINSGRKNIGFLAGGNTSYAGNERKKGFMSAMKAYSLKPEMCEIFNFNERDAYKGILKMLGSKQFKCDALVCANDSMAIGAAKALIESGKKEPEDVLVTGADEKDYLRYFSPSISTFSLLPYEQGVEAFKLLKRQLDGKQKTKHIKLESRLLLGEKP